MSIARTGTFGAYYGNTYDTSNALTTSEMQVNATYIYAYLTNKGWSINSIAAILGNMQAESSINPGRWQSDRVGGESSGHGYGLCQWTPYTKYTEWVSGDPSTMDNNLSRIIYEVENSLQWYGTGNYAGMSFSDFSKSTESVSFLAIGFLLCYERPADQSSSVQEYRASLANAWYEYLTGVTPPPGPGPGPGPTPSGNKKRKKYNFILFDKKKRMLRNG